MSSCSVRPRTGPVFALSIHADYACRHSGACCRAGWTIPVEPQRRPLLGGEWLEPASDGACRFHDADARRCRVHGQHGPDMLPSSGREFPRRALIDDRGVFVTLSHFCPTAAGLLFRTDVPLAIVEQPPAFPEAREYEGLDARGHWPPLVRTALLCDLESYARWERFAIATLARPLTPRRAIATIAAAAERLRRWTPADGDMETFVGQIGDAASDEADERALARYESFDRVEAYEQVVNTVPNGITPPALPDDAARTWETIGAEWDAWSAPVRAYLASKAFASWCAYQAHGIRTLVAELVTTATVLRVEAARACRDRGGRLTEPRLLEAFRAADRLLMHLADRRALTRWLGRVEV
jgi:hypothetical protein